MGSRKVRCALLCLALLLGGASVASADSLTLNFDVPLAGFEPPGSAPWATLALNLNPGGTIDAKLVMSPGLTAQVLGFNIPGSVAGYSVAGLPSGWVTAASASAVFSAPLGTFDAFINSNGSTTQSLLDVTISRTGGFASVQDIVSNSAYGISSQVPFVLDMVDCCKVYEAGANAPAPVPEPASVQLLLLGLCA